MSGKTDYKNNPNYLLIGEKSFDYVKPYIQVTPSVHNENCVFHYHTYIEFVFIESGFSLHSFNGKTTILIPGDLFAIGFNNCHMYFSVNNVKLYNIIFDLSEISEMIAEITGLPGLEFIIELENKNFPLINIEPENRHELISLLEKMNTERENRSAGWELALKAYLIQFLILYSRLYQKAENSSQTGHNSEYLNYIYKSVSFIEENYSADITSSDIARYAGISPKYLAKQFMNKFNISPAEYVRRFKVNKALELIISTDKPLNLIALECGFVNFSAFSRIFKKFMGHSPIYYRKNPHNFSAKSK